MYDNVCKLIVEKFPEEFSTWLLGEAVALTELKPTELSIEPIRADSLLLRQSENIVLHTEFQTRPDAQIPLRMLDYWVRIYRRYPQKKIHQIVIYLKQTDSPLVKQDYFQEIGIRSEFRIIRLWEQPTELFLNSVGLLPLAILTQTEKPIEVLSQVAQKIEKITNTQTKSNVTATAFILAGLLLDRKTINQILRRDVMQDSVTYQEILEEGEAKGKLVGLQEGLEQGREQGVQQGLQRGKLQTIPGLIRLGLSPEQIAEALELNLETIFQAIDELPKQ